MVPQENNGVFKVLMITEFKRIRSFPVNDKKKGKLQLVYSISKCTTEQSPSRKKKKSGGRR